MPGRVEGGRVGTEHCLFLLCDDCEDPLSDVRGYVVEDVSEVGLKCHGALKFEIYFRLGRTRG